MHFPATSVATVSFVISSVCPYEISARRFWRCGFLSLCIFDFVGKLRAMGNNGRATGWATAFNPNLRNAYESGLRGKSYHILN